MRAVIRFDSVGHAFNENSETFHPCCWQCERKHGDGRFLTTMYARKPKKETCCFCGTMTKENNYRTFDHADEACLKRLASLCE